MINQTISHVVSDLIMVLFCFDGLDSLQVNSLQCLCFLDGQTVLNI